jgi:hypothetical protein
VKRPSPFKRDDPLLGARPGEIYVRKDHALNIVEVVPEEYSSSSPLRGWATGVRAFGMIDPQGDRIYAVWAMPANAPVAAPALPKSAIDQFVAARLEQGAIRGSGVHGATWRDGHYSTGGFELSAREGPPFHVSPGIRAEFELVTGFVVGPGR